MADVDDLLQLAYRASDDAIAARIAENEVNDIERLELLKHYADAKRIVTALRALETASGGTLEVRTEVNRNANSVAFTIREPQQFELAIVGQDNKLHGFRLVAEQTGVYLETFDKNPLFVASPDDSIFEDGEISNKLMGAEPALKALFQWAGNYGYIKRPKVYPVAFGRDKPTPP